LSNPRPIEILIVEDSPSDRLMAREALRETNLPMRIHEVEDGIEAIRFLYRRPPYESVPRPSLVLLDLNLPRKDGREVLEEVKNDPALKMIPIVVLTTSKAEQDVVRAYSAHANCYLTKPVGFESFNEIFKTIERFWLGTVVLPP